MKQLTQLYADYKIYPLEYYKYDSPVRVFQSLYPNDHFSQDIEGFLQGHDYQKERRGADLPWWGKKYFSDEEGKRTLIISQDSLAKDAGSVVFFAHLMNSVDSVQEYKKYCEQLNENQSFRYSSWNKIRNQIKSWGLNFDFLFITDAAKVYKDDSLNSFDRKKSKDLLEKEIEMCNPDFLILLGGAPLSLLRKDLNYRDVVEKSENISIIGRKTVVTPFPSGNGLTQENFEDRMEKATVLIKSLISEQ